jgi:DNA-binding MarR family transcriptional regulator
MATAAAVKTPHTEPDGAQPHEGLSDATASKVSSCIEARSPLPGFSAAADELSEEELRAWRGLLRAHASLAKLLDAKLDERHGLPMTSYEVLHRLAGAEMGRMRMCDLAEQAQMSRSGLTRLVDRLESDGLLERCSCEHDARGAYACLTAAGGQRLSEARSTHRSVIREHFLSRFSEQELSSLAELWERIAPCCGSSC